MIKNCVASKETQQERLSICRQCNRFDKHRDKCLECGCYLQYKVKITIFKCPLKKWPN